MSRSAFALRFKELVMQSGRCQLEPTTRWLVTFKQVQMPSTKAESQKPRGLPLNRRWVEKLWGPKNIQWRFNAAGPTAGKRSE